MAAQISTNLMAKLLSSFNLSDVRVLDPQSGYRNTSYPLRTPEGELRNLIIYKSEPGILRRVTAANRVSNYLAATGFPTRRTMGRILRLTGKTRTGTTRVRYAGLYDYLPGDTIPWEAYTKDHIKLLGSAMSRMHAALAQAPDLKLPSNVIGESDALYGRMSTYFAQPGVQSALRTKLHLSLNPTALPTAKIRLQSTLNLPHQPLHMDFVRGNILFGPANNQPRATDHLDAAGHPQTPLHLGGLAITGILDFEKTTLGPRIFDIARTLAFLLVDAKAKTPAQIYKYFLHSGYNKRGAATFEPPVITRDGHQTDLLQALIDFYLLHDFYKFLRHNPYEYLPQNEHFHRTCQLLLQRHLIISQT
jgi:Ser/Thr protein kinase RdoA (MazF antagonist)